MIYIVVGIIVIVCKVIYYVATRRNYPPDPDQPIARITQPKENVYYGLRDQVFNLAPQEFGIPNTEQEKAYSVVLDIGLEPGATMTLVSFVDGNASLYLSSGSGIIGGGTHENVSKAAVDFVNEAGKHISEMAPANSFLLPKMDHAIFYLLTNKNKYFIEEEMDRLENGTSNLTRLFYAGNEVITQLRLTTNLK